MDGNAPTEESGSGLEKAAAAPERPAEGDALAAHEVVPSIVPSPGPTNVTVPDPEREDPSTAQPARSTAGEIRAEPVTPTLSVTPVAPPAPVAPAGVRAAFKTHSEDAPRPKSAHPRGASGAQLDQLRATVKVSARGVSSSPSRASSSSSSSPSVARAQPPPAMNTAQLTLLLEEGRALLEHQPQAAHQKFEAAYRCNLNDVRVLSHYGLTLVAVEGDRQRGIRFCEEAARRGPLTTELLVNLAKALVLTRNKEQAVRALRKAQELAPDDPRIGREFLALGLRRKPAIPFLPRAFFLNKWIGKITWRFGGQKDPFAALP
jgi:hypothetical protein